MVLVIAVPWKKGAVKSDGAVEMVCRNEANTKKHRRGDHGTVALGVSHEVDGLRLTSKDGCSLMISYRRNGSLKCFIGAAKENTLVKGGGGGSTHAGGMF